jgi:hypothetical protein
MNSFSFSSRVRLDVLLVPLVRKLRFANEGKEVSTPEDRSGTRLQGQPVEDAQDVPHLGRDGVERIARAAQQVIDRVEQVAEQPPPFWA